MKNAKKLYELNQRAIDNRYSKEYLLGNRMLVYWGMIKKGKLFTLASRIRRDFKTIRKRKTDGICSNVEILIDFEKPYMGEKIIVYTSVYGKYDTICEPLFVDPNCDYFILTDQDVSKTSIWKKHKVVFPEDVNTDFLKNRYVKMFPHKIFTEYRYSLYIDGNITITSAVSLYFCNFNCATGIAMHKHPANNDLYEEIESCLMAKKISQTEAEEMREKLIREGFPHNYGMFECNIILRDGHNTHCSDVMELWWKELLNGPKRDQLHFTYSLFKLGYQVDDLALLGVNMNKNPMFIRNSHI